MPNEGELMKLNTLSRIFPSMIRFAYNRLLEGCREYEVVERLYELFMPNARWCQWAIKEAKALMEAQKELLPLYIEDLKWRIDRARKRPMKAEDPLKKKGITRRIEKLERKLKELEEHKKNKTLPKIVFGRKKTLKKMSRSKIKAKDEWLIRRRWGFISIGQRNQGGNANTKIVKREDGYSLLIRNTIFDDFEVKLYMPEEFKHYVGNVLEEAAQYTIRVKRTLRNGYQVLITFELEESKVEWNGRKIAGFDVNPLGMAVTIVDRNGNLLASKWFFYPDLVFARREKRNWLIGNLVKKAFKWLKGHGVNTIAIEDLKFKRSLDFPNWVNRLVANFVRKRLIETIKIRALKEKLSVVEVQPAYTSKIAWHKYAKNFPKLNNHQLAAFIIARRALGCGEKLKEPVEISYKLPDYKRIRRVKVLYVWPSIYGHSFHGLVRACSSDGRIELASRAHGGYDRRVTLHSPVASKLCCEEARRRGGCLGDEPRARGHRGSPPLSISLNVNRLADTKGTVKRNL